MQRSGLGNRRLTVEPHLDRTSSRGTVSPACAIVERRSIRIGATLGARRDFGARAVAGIEEVAKLVGRGAIRLQPVGLAHHRLWPLHAKPIKVFADGGVKFGFAAGGIDVLAP